MDGAVAITGRSRRCQRQEQPRKTRERMEKERIDCARNSVKREASSRAPLMACVSAFELRLRPGL
jgi:hypothetical protein